MRGPNLSARNPIGQSSAPTAESAMSLPITISSCRATFLKRCSAVGWCWTEIQGPSFKSVGRIATQRSRSRRGRECAGRFALRLFSSIFARISIGEDTVRQWCGTPLVLHFSLFIFHSHTGLPALDRFPRFSARTTHWQTVPFQGMPKTAEIDQIWPFTLLPSSAVALFPYLRQSTEHT